MPSGVQASYFFQRGCRSPLYFQYPRSPAFPEGITGPVHDQSLETSSYPVQNHSQIIRTGVILENITFPDLKNIHNQRLTRFL